MRNVSADIPGMARKYSAQVVVLLAGFLLGALVGLATQQDPTPVGYQPKLTTSVVV